MEKPAEVSASAGDPAAHGPLALVRTALRQAAPWVVISVLVLALLGGIFRHQLAWGDVATWLLAFLTLLALLAAGFAGLVAYDLLNVETQRDRLAAEERTRVAEERTAQREADRRAQASRVTAWFEQYYEDTGQRVPPDVSPDVFLVTGPATWGAAIRNASDLAVLDVRVFFYFVNDPEDGRPWTAEQRWASPDRIRQVPPGQVRHMELPDATRNMVDECNDQLYLVGIAFTDANGRRWMRDELGALNPVRVDMPYHLTP